MGNKEKIVVNCVYFVDIVYVDWGWGVRVDCLCSIFLE